MVKMSRDLIYALDERIGQPELFVGRKEELDFLQNWVAAIPKKLSRSTALLSRRKKGKTALVERLFNIVYTQNNQVIPFYFEVKEGSKYIVDFAHLFYRTFISQYLGFKARDLDFYRGVKTLAVLEAKAENLGLAKVVENICAFKTALAEDLVDNIWHHAQSAPHVLAGLTGDYIVQIIDEFQFLNSEIYWDKNRTRVADDLAGSYLSLAESKLAPLLVTGSWVSWLKNIIHMQLPGRFVEMELGNLTEEEGLEAVLNYSLITGVPVAKEVAVYLNQLVGSDPFYISALVRSMYKEKDLTTADGLLATLEYELRRGTIYGTWMEYIGRTFDQVNSLNAKKIVLFLSQNREREWTRQEVIEKLQLSYTDREAEEKLQMLVKGDLIAEGSTSVDYRGMQDDIFYKVFRYRYEKEIKNIPLEVSLSEERINLEKRIKKLEKKLNSLLGWQNYHKGHLLEYLLRSYLQFEQYKNAGEQLKDKVYNYQPGAEFTAYREVKPTYLALADGRKYEVDIRAFSFTEGQDLLVSVKNTEKKVGVVEVEEFLKVLEIANQLRIKGYYLFYSTNGFDEQAKEYLCSNVIMYADQEIWPLWPNGQGGNGR